MAEKTTTLTDDSWEKEVLQSPVPVLVDFWAEWCAPCRMMAPTIDALAEEFHGRAKVGKLNIDDNAATADRYNIRGIPTVMLFKKGEAAETLVGVTSLENLSSLIEDHLRD
jgi:thioredoxin 1